MAIFKTLKRAFGFNDSEMEEEELEGIDARVTPLRSRLPESEASAPKSGSDTIASDGVQPVLREDVASDAVSVVPSAIFESVVKIFNESLPGFIKDAVDEKAQCDYIYQSLDSSMKRYLENLDMEARQRCNRLWENERRSLQMQMEALRKKSQKDEEDCSDSKKLQLSAERQKRALSERVHDLEKQLAAMEAENEQYMLENKTLVNKLRLTTLTGGELPEGGDTDTIAERIAEMSKALETAKAECADRDKDIAVLKQALEQSKAKDDIGDAMLTELNKKVAEAQEEAAARQADTASANEIAEGLKTENEALRKDLDAARQLAETFVGKQNEIKLKLESVLAENGNLKSEIADLKIKHGATEEELREALDSLEVVNEMQRQLSSLEEARVSNEAFLRKQKDEIKQKDELIRQADLEKNEYAETLRKKDETIHSLEELADSLRKTIEENLYEHAQSQSALRSEIDRLKGGRAALYPDAPAGGGLAAEPAEDSAAVENKSHSKKKLKISAIDETLEDTDWLIATPPPAKKKNPVDDDPVEFGYREPVKKSTPDNPAQMSLW